MPAKKPSQAIAILALLLNIIVLPGVGSFVANRNKEGLWQVVLFGAGGALTLTLIGAVVGIPMMIAAWVWALVTGIKIVRESQ